MKYSKPLKKQTRFDMGSKRKETPIKFCMYCGEKMERNRYNGTLEDLTRFKKRKYCGVDCMAKAMVKSGTLTKCGYLARGRKYLKPACAVCGSTEKLNIHHKDRDRSNNDPENLETLCPSCHMKLHWANGDIPGQEKKQCKLCGQPAKGHGLCQKHYSRWYRHGNPKIRFGVEAI
jgi:5-methylcytosine-specific restriction endonuclease McrA